MYVCWVKNSKNGWVSNNGGRGASDSFANYDHVSGFFVLALNLRNRWC